MLGKIDKAGAKVQFRYMGKNIPLKQGVEMLKKVSNGYPTLQRLAGINEYKGYIL